MSPVSFGYGLLRARISPLVSGVVAPLCRAAAPFILCLSDAFRQAQADRLAPSHAFRSGLRRFNGIYWYPMVSQ